MIPHPPSPIPSPAIKSPLAKRVGVSRRGKNKYGAIKTVVDGITFASKLEARYYGELKLREKAGEVCEIETHPVFPITINGLHVCNVILDFRYYDKVEKLYRVADTKGRDTDISRLKRKMVQATYHIVVELPGKKRKVRKTAAKKKR